jgi:ADP-heptose:LPS heptosyltransferase
VSDSQGKILVVRGGAIGDFVLTLPVLAALRARFPTAPLEVLGYAHIARLALLGGLADAVRSIDARPLVGFFARDGCASDEVRDYFAGFTLIVSYLYDPEEIFRQNVARCSEARFLQGPHRPNEAAGLHASEVFLKPLERLGIFDADPTPRLSLAVRPSHLPCDLALHPGSGSEKKNWPEERWGRLLERVGGERGRRLLLVGGEAEGERLSRLAGRARCEVEVAANLPLPELAARLAACRLFVGHDSGITHLAAALGLGGLVLWGGSAEAVWRPRCEAMRILRARDDLSRLGVEAVLEALTPLLETRGGSPRRSRGGLRRWEDHGRATTRSASRNQSSKRGV